MQLTPLRNIVCSTTWTSLSVPEMRSLINFVQIVKQVQQAHGMVVFVVTLPVKNDSTRVSPVIGTRPFRR